jgi:hypothetical protein
VQLPRIGRKYAHLTVAVTLYDGAPATVAGVDVALLARYAAPTGATVWTAATPADGGYTVLLAGPDAPGGGALVVPAGGGDLWARITDGPEIDAARIGPVHVLT